MPQRGGGAGGAVPRRGDAVPRRGCAGGAVPRRGGGAGGAEGLCSAEGLCRRCSFEEGLRWGLCCGAEEGGGVGCAVRRRGGGGC